MGKVQSWPAVSGGKLHGNRAAHKGGDLRIPLLWLRKGVGPRVAEAIFKEFGLNTLEIMEEHPQELLKVKGISQKRLKGIVESYGKNRVFRELMTFLAPYKVTPKKVNLILQKFRSDSVEIVRHRPYRLCAVKGLGF